ncbi:hypothetical protein OIU74_022674 [Salix koriyanagi]|uniref:Uncharacterized protein n=1 Tax=Salix koriyanagi TaxID=2511006 RepID=A0A9Q0WLQ0_9ROSI|nr:hypothetical protein OIU74_022674 [Salix koriyanagi]
MSSDERNQTAARALMPPPRPSNNLYANPVHAQSRFGASSSKNSWKQRAEISTSSNTSSSISGSSFRAGGSSGTRTGHSSNLSSNSDAHKPRRKRRPKKKKQQACYSWLCYYVYLAPSFYFFQPSWTAVLSCAEIPGVLCDFSIKTDIHYLQNNFTSWSLLGVQVN